MVIAFIPVRGGSKSIPLKNIKQFCGKPLVLWSIEALEECDLVDKIVVATDSDKIWDVVAKQHLNKTSLYRRKPENAIDTATTESVMLEYINYASLNADDTFMLVQATSPLTQTTHFSEALSKFFSEDYDSLLSCVRVFRFFWKDDGTSLNYDYENRPRRQDFDGTLMENGAFYISSVGNIIKNKNRLNGKIGIYEMPGFTAFEIDEPSDWHIMESLMSNHVLSQQHRKESLDIKLFLTDIDGTLTDGGMYYSENGDELKKFNTRDGMGISLLKKKGIKVGIITSEDRVLNIRRARKLNVDYIVQGKKEKGKLEIAKEISEELKISLNQVAYIGDDVNCYDLLSNVGLAACPADANIQIKSIPGIHIMNKNGGQGCVREFIDDFLL